MIHAKDMLEATLLVLHMIFGSDHPLVISTAYFVARYNSDRLAIQHHLASHDASHYEAKFVQYFGLRLANWFRGMESSPVLLAAPDFQQILINSRWTILLGARPCQRHTWLCLRGWERHRQQQHEKPSRHQSPLSQQRRPQHLHQHRPDPVSRQCEVHQWYQISRCL
jgi:hypothetical protein